MSRFRFGIMGGDYRYKIMHEMLFNDGYIVKAYCNNHIKNCFDNIDDFLDDIDVLIAPIPCSKDDIHIFFTDCNEILIEDLFEKMHRRNIKIFIGGVITDKIKTEAGKHSIKTIDYFELEEVAVKNAIPTAEGAIQTAMIESNKTLFASNVLVLGYGRCGKILSNMLKGIGANVYVTYRNEKDSSYIKAFGMNGFNLYELKSYIGKFDFIFNTIPSDIINKEILKKVRKSSVIIDIAQAPGGVDFNFARNLNLKALYCPGLPGRVAPYTAAEILKEATINICLSHLELV